MNRNTNYNHQLATVVPNRNSVDKLMSSPEIREKMIQYLEKIRIDIDMMLRGAK